MTSPQSQADERERRWGAVLVTCLEAFERGRAVDRPALLAAHPEFAKELAEFFAQRDRIERLGAPLRAVAQGAAAHTDLDLPEDTFDEASGAAADPAVRSFGDYEIIARIARGGMGVVYKARQKSLNRTVALKMIRSRDLGPAEQQRFRLEAEIIARLDHPNIVPIYEVGEIAGRPGRFVSSPVKRIAFPHVLGHHRLRPMGAIRFTTLADTPRGGQ